MRSFIYFVASDLVLVLFRVRVRVLVLDVVVVVVLVAVAVVVAAVLRPRSRSFIDFVPILSDSINFSLSHMFIKVAAKQFLGTSLTQNSQRSMLNVFFRQLTSHHVAT